MPWHYNLAACLPSSRSQLRVWPTVLGTGARAVLQGILILQCDAALILRREGNDTEAGQMEHFFQRLTSFFLSETQKAHHFAIAQAREEPG